MLVYSFSLAVGVCSLHSCNEHWMVPSVLRLLGEALGTSAFIIRLDQLQSWPFFDFISQPTKFYSFLCGSLN